MSAHAFLRICFVYALVVVAFAALPSYIHVCHRKDPEIEKCITNSIEQLRSYLSDGIPELSVPSVDPLLLQNVHLQRGPNTANIYLNITDVQVYGPSTFKIRDLKIKFNKESVVFRYHILFDKLHFKGKHQIDARILLLQIKGQGDLTGNFYNYDGDVTMKANKIRKNNNTYLYFEKMKFIINVGKAEFNLTNLFNGDEVLGKATNDLLNENSDVLLDEVKPLLENALEDLFTDIANKITEKFTYEELFPID